MKRLTKYLVVALVALTLLTVTAEAAGAGTNFVPKPPTNQGTNPSLGLRGPYGTQPPGGSTPAPTYVTPGGWMIGPDAVDIGDLVCMAYDYIKDKCAAWRKKNKATSIQIWNAYGGGPILNYLWANPAEATHVELGYFFTHDNANRYCHAWDYTNGLCVGWNPKVVPYAPQYPVTNYIWVNPATLKYQMKGYFGSSWSPWYG